jgi:hypothetical protein
MFGAFMRHDISHLGVIDVKITRNIAPSPPTTPPFLANYPSPVGVGLAVYFRYHSGSWGLRSASRRHRPRLRGTAQSTRHNILEQRRTLQFY